MPQQAWSKKREREAKQMGIEGRSRMTKQQLQRAVERRKE